MIIECINCNKKFDVNSELIPSEGRTIQCGACNHVWFFRKNDLKQQEIVAKKVETKKSPKKLEKIKSEFKEFKSNNNDKIETFNDDKENYQLTKYESKTNFSFSKILSSILVLIISFIALLVVLDTFKTPLYEIFPKLEYVLFSFYELLTDIRLFINDLLL